MLNLFYVFQGPDFLGFTFFRVQVFQRPGFSEYRFFRVQIFLGSVFFEFGSRVRVQVLEVAHRSMFCVDIVLFCEGISLEDSVKNVFLEILQTSQENICARISF